MATTNPSMIGGKKLQEDVLEWFSHSKNLFLTVFMSILILWVSFVNKLPVAARWQLSTSFGRLLLLLLLYIVYNIAGWTPALLMTIAIALTWAVRPLTKPTQIVEEGFDVKKTKVASPLWFVERVLNENPKAIIEDRVMTDAPADDNARKSKYSR